MKSHHRTPTAMEKALSFSRDARGLAGAVVLVIAKDSFDRVKAKIGQFGLTTSARAFARMTKESLPTGAK